MRFEHSVVVEASVEEVRAFLDDVQHAADCLPGVEDVKHIEGDTYEGRMKIRIGPLALNIVSRANIAKSDLDHWQVTGEGRDTRVGAGVKATLDAAWTAVTPTTTEVAMTADVTFSGRLGELGQPLIKRKADQLISDFAENLKQAFAKK